MSGTYLPGDTRQRIQDLIKDNNIFSLKQCAVPLPVQDLMDDYESDLIKIITGIRRCGKSVIVTYSHHFRCR